MSPVVSTKPYMLRALYEWCADQGLTPYISVQVDAQTLVPRQFVRDGQIVLNLGADAVQNLHMGNDLITCQARFGGVAQSLSIPIGNVAAIYARENGQGMAFEVGEQVEAPAVPAGEGAPESPEPPPPDTPPRSHLTRVK
ncbi:MAG: ClpXP protease specificity-enhancing factor [Rhodocyclaceae bacterium]|jgi:stringent starvation protein B|nr:ClpXP protease specificity-enhancing factor [Rhodocyclaceae bacterium]MBX3677245.1 ClpXP protease specificity-enhancing factor [Rhodocyclaceae bacterium]MCO5098904.1 ClpXP protease specificity-enhancing factor [Rhodocyclaceae bacterium]MCP5297672.1 ClpXP protease specificity-enhancing factor [Zoogloeaceae bacterium]PKO69531.1 MAG: ClpXP protease specificity-enhancing factor [Betaproteobacteria bacterium HGW-Betaproteobacteria-14]